MMRTKSRFRLLAPALVLVAAASLTACSIKDCGDAPLPACATEDRGDALIAELLSIADKPDATYELADLTSWEWDEVFFFSEGESIERIKTQTGIELKGGLLGDGNYLFNSTLVFRNNDEVVETVQSTAAPLHYDGAEPWQPYKHPAAVKVRGGIISFAP